METACIRIRFTPLLKNLQKENSKHSLEIVPEVSCIQNLDKIAWRKEENSIEYTIPMTYKIILRKKEMMKEELDSMKALEKTYHSCVDLLLPSSDTNITTLGSGDINRNLSDTFVLTNLTANVESFNIRKINTPYNAKRMRSSIELVTTQVQTEVHSYPSISSQLEYNELIDYSKALQNARTQTSIEVFQHESLVQVGEADIFDCIKRSIDKITNTDGSTSTLKCNASVQSLETLSCMLAVNKTETKCKLTLTPICSINTCDDQTGPVARGINTIVFKVYETGNSYEKHIETPKIINSDLTYDNLRNSNRDVISRCKSLNQHDYIKPRLLPEVRVANFIQVMEKEIMPLKQMLGDIINRCSSLGFTWNTPQQNSFIYKDDNLKEQVKKCFKSKEQTKSNRVVYTIVFDG